MEEADREGGSLLGRSRPLGAAGLTPGRPAPPVPGHAARRAGLAAHTQHALPGCVSLGTLQAGPCPGLDRTRARAGPKNRLPGGLPGLVLHGQL